MDYHELFLNIQQAARELSLLDVARVNKLLHGLASEIESETKQLIEANQKDLSRMDVANPKYDRLRLTAERISAIASDIRNVAGLSSPLGRTLFQTTRPNGLIISKVSVPIGVIGIIYEARPNVTLDVFSLCIKSGNACLLKGGSDAEYSNQAIANLIEKVLVQHSINPNVVKLMPSQRESTTAMLTARGYVDLIIPRGSQSLIDYVCEHSKVPVIETGAGIVHTYLDRTGNRDKASAIINNAKTRRVSVCNALDCLIVHKERLNDLSYILNPLAESHVIIYADQLSYQALQGRYPSELLQHADESSYGTEFLDYKMSIKTVDNIDLAIEHIRKHSSKHSEAIISESHDQIELFLNEVDAAAVYANTSTSFSDGAQFGLGAEIGISTQKIHARGPMGLQELTSYKWIVRGNGQIRG